jgi:hypothetical protein
MQVCLFLTFRARGPGAVPGEEISKLEALLQYVPHLQKALLHTPVQAKDPYVDDRAPPQLALQLYFADVTALEAALRHGGKLEDLHSRQEFPRLADADVLHQAMVVRAFPLHDPRLQNPQGAPYCTYLVSYEGAAEDLNAWLAHYLDRHTVHMAHFPGIRELEVYTRLDWVSDATWPRADFMQRNKVAFDSPEALTKALHSPVRHEMRADYETFPKFTGPTRHFAMLTRCLST